MLRALQPDILIALGFCVVVGAAWAASRRLLVWSVEGAALSAEQLLIRRWLNRLAVLFVAFALLWLIWCVVLLTTNELPRSDIDRGGVYDQMNSHIEKKP